MMRAEPDTFTGQIGRGLAAVLRQRGGTVTLRLNPESLGQLKISLTLEESRVSARFESSSPEARQLLTQHSDSLRQALESRGLSIDNLSIVAPDHGVPAKNGAEAHDPRPIQGHNQPCGSSFQQNATASDGGSQSGYTQSEQSMGGAPWGTFEGGRDRAAESPGDSPDQGPTAWHTGQDAGAVWLRVDTIA